MYCKKCGIENRDDARFCWSCGTCLVERNACGQEQKNEQQSYNQNNYSGNTYDQNRYNDGKYGQGYSENGYSADPRNQNHYGNDPFFNPYNPYAYPVPTQKDPAKGLSIASFVLGLLAFIAVISFPNPLGIIFGPLGIIFGSAAKGKGSKSVFSILGIIFGAIGLALVILMFIACPETSFESLPGYMY